MHFARNDRSAATGATTLGELRRLTDTNIRHELLHSVPEEGARRGTRTHDLDKLVYYV